MSRCVDTFIFILSCVIFTDTVCGDISITISSDTIANKKYEFVVARVTWQGALEACVERNGRLAVIENQAMSDEIGGFLINIAPKLSEDFKANYWINARNNWKSAFDPRWQTSEEKDLTFTDWARGEPDNNKLFQEDCVSLLPDRWYEYRWHDVTCNLKNAYICEYEDH